DVSLIFKKAGNFGHGIAIQFRLHCPYHGPPPRICSRCSIKPEQAVFSRAGMNTPRFARIHP
ncbi:MAG: hypothetical protein ACXWMI_09520, partial [Syntrophales bacterium]